MRERISAILLATTPNVLDIRVNNKEIKQRKKNYIPVILNVELYRRSNYLLINLILINCLPFGWN